MSLIRYTTFPTGNLTQHLNRMFEDFDNAFGRAEESGSAFVPPLDVKEDALSYVVTLEVPGISQDDLQIDLESNTLVIRGVKSQSPDETESTFRRIERSFGSFARSVSFPRNVDTQQVSAHLADGVLTVRLVKEEQAKPRQIKIGTATNEN